MKLIGVGLAPSAVNSDVKIGAGGTRNLMPFRSSGVLIGWVDVVTWRKPLSQTLDIVSRPGFSDLRAHIGAERAVHRLPDCVVVVEREAGVDDAGRRHQRRQRRTRTG